MTSKELVLAALAGQKPPRVPTGPLAVHFCAGLAGYTLRQYTTDAGALAESVIRYYERFRPDSVWLSADTWVSAEAMGARVGATDDQQPFGGLGQPLVRTVADIDRIPAPDVGSQGRYPLMLEALDRIVRALGKSVFIVACCDQFPFSLASALMGINDVMVRVLEDPAFVEALMHRCAEFQIAYAAALAQGGADMISGGDSPAGLIGPRFYGQLVQPAERRVIAGIKSRTGKLVSLHICGKAAPLLPAMAATGADVLELDHDVDIGQACRTLGPNIGVWGNLDPVRLLAQGTPQSVRAGVRQILAAIKQTDHCRFILSSGCTLAVETPTANLEALFAEAAGDAA